MFIGYCLLFFTKKIAENIDEMRELKKNENILKKIVFFYQYGILLSYSH